MDELSIVYSYRSQFLLEAFDLMGLKNTEKK